MIRSFLFLLLFFNCFINFSQQTKIYGKITDASTGETLPFVRIKFYDSKIGTLADSVGNYVLESYYGTDSIQVFFAGYVPKTIKIKKDISQEINIKLEIKVSEVNEVVIKAPDELPSTRLHKRVIKNKDINNKVKLNSYDYELYNKVQLDINNIGDRFSKNPIIKRLDLVMDYLDSADNGKNFLPVLLSESISNFYFKNNPKKKREIISASKVSGVDNFQINQLLGDMYLDMNIYDNNINLFQRNFVSPVSNVARNFYRFYLEDSTFIGKQWCYKLRFTPKRTGDMTFEGEMWIHDTTYAVKSIKASISPWANINYVQDLYFEQEFDQVEKEVWMMTRESMIVDLKITKKSAVYGFFARKVSSRKQFVINKEKEAEFYNADNTVEYTDSALLRSEKYWLDHRHEPLSIQEIGIENMIDSLENTSMFRSLKTLAYLGATGFYDLGKLELGNAFSLLSINTVEGVRTGLALRTSNKFSRKIELSGKFAYGFGDERFKYGSMMRLNTSKKKRGLLTAFYNHDVEQFGMSSTAASAGSTFNTLFATAPLNKLTFVEKVGVNFEKDVKKDLVLFGAIEWKEFLPIGLTVYEKYDAENILQRLTKIQTTEFTARIRWTKDEEFLSGAFDRSTLRSKYPIFILQGVFGVKGVFGSDYSYQKVEFRMNHNASVGVFGYLKYGIEAGYVFGTVAYPFLKIHEGSQTYWLMTNAFNKLNFFEFISDSYIGGNIEQHWEGLFFDRIPLIKKLKWRLVTTGRITYGSISERHQKEMILPDFTRRFGKIPYAEAAVGIENIFKVGRVDLVWRLTHLEPVLPTDKKINPLGIRFRWAFIF